MTNIEEDTSTEWNEVDTDKPVEDKEDTVEFETDGAYIEQSFTVQGNSTYQIFTLGKSANAGTSNFDITLS